MTDPIAHPPQERRKGSPMTGSTIVARNGQTSRRALLKGGAAGAAAGAASPWFSLSTAAETRALRNQTQSVGGLSAAGLDRMHEIMAGYVERGDAPGLVTLVSRRGD